MASFSIPLNQPDGQSIALKTVVDRWVTSSAADWRDFAGLFESRRPRPGAHFLRAGAPAAQFRFVNAGLLRFFYQTADGREFNKSFSCENEFAGAYSAYLTNTPARFNIQAHESCYLMVAEFDDLSQLFGDHRCWERLGRLLVEQLYIKKEQREAEFLLDDAKTRYTNFRIQHPGLEQRLTQYQVASYLGITAVALSRIRQANR